MTIESKWDEDGVEDFVATILVYERLPEKDRKHLAREVEEMPDMIWDDYVTEAKAIIALLRAGDA